MKKRIIVVEDEADICDLIKYNLSAEGFQVDTFTSGEEGLKAVFREMPDLVLLDIMIPGLGGLDILKKLKAEPQTAGIPVAMITAKNSEIDIVIGLELGADDYITKPFSTRVLVARVKAVLRRAEKDEAHFSPTILKTGGIIIDQERHTVSADGENIELTHSEFLILHLLARNPQRVFSRYQIVNEIHGSDHMVTDRTIDVHIAGLRKKLGSCGENIRTVRGFGYKLDLYDDDRP